MPPASGLLSLRCRREVYPLWPDENLLHHFIPQDREVWSISNYEKFCEEREKLLADGIGKLLRSLGVEGSPKQTQDS